MKKIIKIFFCLNLIFVFINQETSFAKLAKKKHTYSDPCDNAFDDLPKVDDNPIFFVEFQNFYKKNVKCIDAGLIEEIHSRLVLGINKNWKQLDQLIDLTQKDLKYRQFILSNYSVLTNGYITEAENTLKKSKRCLKKQINFCKDLQVTIKKTLDEEKKQRK